MSLNVPARNAMVWYSVEFKKPTAFPADWLMSAIKPAHSGATALVPPTVKLDPSTWT